MIENLKASQNGVLAALLFSACAKTIYNTEQEEVKDILISAYASTVKFTAIVALQVFSLRALTEFAPKKIPLISKLASPSITMSLATYALTKIYSSESIGYFNTDHEEGEVLERKLAFIGVVALFVLKSVTDKTDFVDLLLGAVLGSLVGLTDTLLLKSAPRHDKSIYED